MSRAVLILAGQRERQTAHAWIEKADVNTRVEFRTPRRSIPQNDRMWAMLTDVSRQVVWYGQKLTPEDWKDVLTAALRKARVVPGIEPGSFVPLGMRTSDMGRDEMSALMELITAFGAEHGVTFSDPPSSTARGGGGVKPSPVVA